MHAIEAIYKIANEVVGLRKRAQALKNPWLARVVDDPVVRLPMDLFFGHGIVLRSGRLSVKDLQVRRIALLLLIDFVLALLRPDAFQIV